MPSWARLKPKLPSILFWDPPMRAEEKANQALQESFNSLLRSSKGHEYRGDDHHEWNEPSILFWDPQIIPPVDDVGDVRLTLYTFNSLLRSSVLGCLGRCRVLSGTLTFNSLLRSSDVRKLMALVASLINNLQFSFEILAFGNWLYCQVAASFNSLLRSSGSSGFIWVFKFCCLF